LDASSGKTISGRTGSSLPCPMQLLMFSKKLGSLDVEALATAISELGFDGVDLTVRPSGHVEPRSVERELPEAVEILESFGLKIPMITTSVVDARDPDTESIFRTASELGIAYLKLGYWRYEGFGHARRQLKEAHRRLAEIDGLSSEHGVTSLLHVHSGDYLTATPCLLLRLLNGFGPEHIAAYIDPGHMTVEGGRSGWKIGMDMLSDYIRVVAVKDFGWERDPDRPKRWVLKHMPLSEGLVPWSEVFSYLRQISFDGPVSLHSEYEDMSVSQIISQTAEDLSYLRETIGRL